MKRLNLGEYLRPTEIIEDEYLEADPSALVRLAGAIFVAKREPNAQPMAMFSAYFDSSGNAVDQPRVIVSGYIANYGQWKLFETAWSLAHTECGVELPFHMSEFIAALENPKYKLQKNARADYVAIAQTPEKALGFLRRLTNIQMCGVLCGVSVIVDMGIYESVDSVLALRDVFPPYALGARMCLANVRTWERTFKIFTPVDCIFEEGDFEQGKFTRLMIDEGEPCPIYKRKTDFAGLQAADMYAWEQAHFLRRHQINPQVDPRREFGMLLHAVPKIHTHAPVEVLVNLCHAKGIEIRKN
jgi:hypothetical protein